MCSCEEDHSNVFECLNISKKDMRIFNILEKYILSNEYERRFTLAAAIVYKGNVVSFGRNKMKTHTFQNRFKKNEDSIYLHAETDAIKNALKVVDVEFLERCSIYILRYKKDKNNHKKRVLGMAKPCDGCNKAIVEFGLKKVYFSTDNGYSCL